MTDMPVALIVDADPNDLQGTLDRAAATFMANGTVAMRYDPHEPLTTMTV